MSERSVHDNNVYAYDVDCERRRIVLHTEYRDAGAEEYTDVTFSGVVAHHFEDVLAVNVLFDLTEVEPGEIVRTWAELFARRKNYGWPDDIRYDDPEELISALVARGVRGYDVGSSYGLTGWVLATGMTVSARAGRVETAG